MEQVRCNLCGEDSPKPYITTSDRFSGKEYTLSICSSCGLIYLTSRPTSAELAAYYPDEYEAYSGGIHTDGRHWLDNKTGVLSVQLGYVEKYHSHKGKLLDVGSATGNFIDYARKNHWQVVGIEVIEKAVTIARESHNLEIINSELEEAIIPPASFDVITLWDVLEHLPNPRSALNKIYKILKPDGLVFFSIPNLSSYDRWLFSTEWIGWDSPRHFTLFSSALIERLLKETGFTPVNRKCLTGGKGTFFLSLDRVIKKKPSIGWIKYFYPLISLLLWPYRQISYLVGRGPIMYYAAKKR